MIPSMKRLAFGCVMVACCAALATASEVAISLDPNQATVWTFPNVDANYGWEFTVTEPLEVTHLGMLDIVDINDATPDGFVFAHEVGLFETTGAFLGSVTLGQGDSGLLVDNFRYTAVPDITLLPGVNYVVASHMPASTFLSADLVISDIPAFGVHPSVNYVVARFGTADSLVLPPDLWDPDGIHPFLFGPNLMFVPEPATAALLGLGACALIRRRPRQLG